MSGDPSSLPCPLCSHIGVFESVQSLRDKLISVSTSTIPCPVCQEEVAGLDKLTIHLFSHVKIVSIQNDFNIKANCDQNCGKSKIESNNKSHQKKNKSTATKNRPPPVAANAPMKFVKICPKIPVISLNTVPVSDISQGHLLETNLATVCVPTVKTEGFLMHSNIGCNICGLKFANENILRMHKCLIHSSSDNSNGYHCHLCSKIFKMRGSLMVHLRVAHFGFKCGEKKSDLKDDIKHDENFQNLLEDKTPESAMERNENKQWQCDVCRKCFTTKYFLKKHKRLHTGETPYSCTQCNKTFTFQQSYHKHLLYHNDEKPHTCSYCGRAFKELSTLHNHQRIHTGEKPFACETCGKCFRQRVSYLVHRRIHTGVMPYKCTACDKSFRYKVSQRTHKCQAQPPGTVIRQTGELLEKLKKKQTDPPTNSSEVFHEQNEPCHSLPNSNNNIISTYTQVSEANAELIRKGAELSLEDMESDNFTLISEPFATNSLSSYIETESIFQQEVNNVQDNVESKTQTNILLGSSQESAATISDDNNVPSPSEILKNLCITRDDDYNIGILENVHNEKEYDISDLNVYL